MFEKYNNLNLRIDSKHTFFYIHFKFCTETTELYGVCTLLKRIRNLSDVRIEISIPPPSLTFDFMKAFISFERYISKS